MFEHRTKPLLPRKVFYRRLVNHAVFGFAVITGALGLGMIGYHVFEKMAWVDAFVNAAMILSGMGPVATLQKRQALVHVSPKIMNVAVFLA